ncbi:ankyrin repeat domain-containing protein [Kovacikia minuta CCNUW1]|uniref:ankyrin repeat domain-containing protein n=1 Tax=Kovacikia minuta TaxID=2931930 RepID=UPI001CCC8DEC|nr:ankyrin repeat domain-containing protein [Kovacikia minuta]UBF23655.1 ankyrin repeat domain-containing protein [Kovacikia minuta CCNUW1]
MDNELLKACKERDVERVVELVRQGVNVNVKDQYKDTPLIYLAGSHAMVIKEDLVPAIRALIQAGAKVDVRGSEGITPLYHAVLCYNEPVALVLIELGANVNVKDRKGVSVLMQAVSRNLENVINALLEKGVDTHCRCRAGKDVLSRIGADTSPELVRKLIQFGADAKANHSSGLVKAILSNNWDTARELIASGAEVDARGSPGNETYLMFLSRWGRKTSESAVEQIKFLLSVNANPNAKNSLGQTALDIAIEAGNHEIVEVLRDTTSREG